MKQTGTQSNLRNAWLTAQIVFATVLMLFPEHVGPALRHLFTVCLISEVSYMIWTMKRTGTLSATPSQLYELAKAGKLRTDPLDTLAITMMGIAVFVMARIPPAP